MSATLSTHVLDAVEGTPAAAVAVTLSDGRGRVVTSGETDDGGRLTVSEQALPAGIYTLTFDSGAYFRRTGTSTFYPHVDITFEVPDSLTPKHLHVPLLLSPFAYSTYKGS